MSRSLSGGRPCIDRAGAVLPTTNSTDLGEEYAMDKTTDSGEPASELEHLIADLSGSGPLVFVFGDGFTTAHLVGVTTPLFRGPADRRWWHVELGDDAASWTMDVRVDEVTGVRFVRKPYPFPSFRGREVLVVEFLGPGKESALGCYVHDLYKRQRMRPEKLEAWQALRERYGNRDESRVDRGSLLPPAA
jgi:putative heme iron utilization protein